MVLDFSFSNEDNLQEREDQALQRSHNYGQQVAMQRLVLMPEFHLRDQHTLSNEVGKIKKELRLLRKILSGRLTATEVIPNSEISCG